MTEQRQNSKPKASLRVTLSQVKAMDAEAIVAKLNNAQGAVEFMQREHSAVLKGLHEEIEKLQHKCSDLLFKVELHEDFDDELESLKKTISQQENQLVERDRLISDLRANQKWRELQLQNELQLRERREERLKEEIDKLSSLLSLTPSPSPNSSASAHSSAVWFKHGSLRKMYSSKSAVDRAMTSRQLSISPLLPVRKGEGDGNPRVYSSTSAHQSLQKPILSRPLSAASTFGDGRRSRYDLTLPPDYRAPVATLPPIIIDESQIIRLQRPLVRQQLRVQSAHVTDSESEPQSIDQVIPLHRQHRVNTGFGRSQV